MSMVEKTRRSGRQTRERIEQEALRLFAQKGVDGTSIRDIALAVGVADAALYRHFAAKDEIAGSLFRKHYGDLARQISQIAAQEQPFPTLVRRLVGLFCDLFDGAPDVFRFILVNQHDHLGVIDESENAVAQLTALMVRAAEAGDIAVHYADLAAAIALGAVVQPAVFKLYGRLPGPMREQESQISASILAALSARAL